MAEFQDCPQTTPHGQHTWRDEDEYALLCEGFLRSASLPEQRTAIEVAEEEGIPVVELTTLDVLDVLEGKSLGVSDRSGNKLCLTLITPERLLTLNDRLTPAQVTALTTPVTL